METEKSQLEDTLLRSMMQNAISKKMDKKGVDVEDYRDIAEKSILENLMKLFAVCTASLIEIYTRVYLIFIQFLLF